MGVFIIEANNPEDFYLGRLDGEAVRGLLATLRLRHERKIVFDAAHLQKAIKRSRKGSFQAIHLSVHGNADGIGLPSGEFLKWVDFAALFKSENYKPKYLTMSSCGGASIGIAEAFAKQKNRPDIIFGSPDDLNFGDYVVAWAILYRRLQIDGISKKAAQTAMRHINAATDNSFIYRRWDAVQKCYKTFRS